jgi:hypothetical protein
VALIGLIGRLGAQLHAQDALPVGAARLIGQLVEKDLPASGRPPRTASRKGCGLNRAPSRPHGWHMRSNEGAGVATTGARSSRAGAVG